MAAALALSHALSPRLQPTPFVLGFAAVILAARLAGRQAGLLAVALGALGYAWFRPSLPAGAFATSLTGFVVVSSTFSWLVARRYEIEAVLRSSESRLQEAQQLANVGSWDWNVVDGTEAWSDQMFRILGLEPGSVTPSFETFVRFLHPQDRALVDRIVQRAFVDHQTFECDHRIIRPDGVSPDGVLLDMNRAGREMIGADTLRVDSHLVPFDTSTEGGSTNRAVLSVTHDVTERRRLKMTGFGGSPAPFWPAAAIR